MKQPGRLTRSIVSLHCVLALAIAYCLPASADEDFQRGMELYQQRQFEHAIPHFQMMLAKPLSKQTRSNMLTIIGNCHYELDELQLALAYHDRAIQEDPTNERAHTNKGIVYRLLGEYEAAEACYQEALKLAPQYAELHGSLGTLAMVQGKHEKAIRYLQQSIELDGTHPVAHSNLALAYASVGRFDDAEAELQLAIDLGYHQEDAIRRRIDALRASAELVD